MSLGEWVSDEEQRVMLKYQKYLEKQKTEWCAERHVNTHIEEKWRIKERNSIQVAKRVQGRTQPELELNSPTSS